MCVQAYKTITAEIKRELDEEVSEALEAGYVLAGPLVVVTTTEPRPHTATGFAYFQPVQRLNTTTVWRNSCEPH